MKSKSVFLNAAQGSLVGLLAVAAFLIIPLAVSGLETDTGKLDSGLWVTWEQAALADPPPLPKIRFRALGPVINIISPEDGKIYQRPVRIDVKFSSPAKAIDLSSFKAVYVKTLLSIDITDKVRSYVTSDGINVPDAPLPEGKHTIDISIADMAKNLSQKRISFMVK